MTNTRANRISIVSKGGELVATYWKTHEQVLTLKQSETGFMAQPDSTPTQVREQFRQWLTGKAKADVLATYGVEYDPQDARTDTNKTRPVYKDELDLIEDIAKVTNYDVHRWLPEAFVAYEIDSLTPKTKTGKGTDLTTMGVIDGKYLKSGNLAWFDVEVLCTITNFGSDTTPFKTEMLLKMELVSGQLKKPAQVGDGYAYTQAGMRRYLAEDVPAVFGKQESKEEPKQEESKEEQKLRTGKLTDNEKAQRAHFDMEISMNGTCTLGGSMPNCAGCTGGKCKWRELI